MEIREATHDDIPEILEVLKLALGESSSKKTEEIWRYKHIDNPFGESFILLAIEDSKIIGVRAFMRWKWQIQEKEFHTFRAVDTATHPEHRGKGIFKRLTLTAIDILKDRQDGFIFNTPNDQSRPGYLKMGWIPVSKLKVNLAPNFSLLKLNKRLNLKNSKISNERLELYNQNCIKSNQLFTPKSNDYLEWRYRRNPMQSYTIIESDNVFIAGYVKDHKKFKEFRISEHIENKDSNKSKDFLKQILSHSNSVVVSRSKRTNLLSFSGNLGPLLVYRPLDSNKNNDYKFLEDINLWNYSLGDLELF